MTPRSTTGEPLPARSVWANAGTAFAGVLMTVGGVLDVLNGIAGIAGDDVYEPVGDYVYSLGLTGWGWIHVVVGALVALTGLGILKGFDAARAFGVGLAALYLVENFMFLPYAPVWSTVSIAVAVFVIWALVAAPRATR
ncbi:DUF7144 family membrane protein [Streptomyces fructofermentans]|uniref:DUF7144 family membrane protein n=1 Tax=Streptomyces fructofermentans TaxID=152141 RepID=UPI0033CFBA6F